MSAPADPHLLLLGGTYESRVLRDELAEAFPGWRVTTSLAGRVDSPGEVAGEVRVGGFGGVDGLVAWLAENDVSAVIDATHPFASRITANAAQACAAAEMPLLRLERPAWEAGAADDWRHVADAREAAGLADTIGERLLVTIGRQEVSAFADVAAWCLLRCVDAPEAPLPARHEVLLDRGPYTLESERALIADRGIDVLVTKNSGGEATSAKLLAAREAGLPVVVIDRPTLPDALDVASSVPEALLWLASVSAGRARHAGLNAEQAQGGGEEPDPAPGSTTDPEQAEAALRGLGLPLSGDVEHVLAMLRTGRPVDIDNAAGWPLPELGPSAGVALADAQARVLVTDMAPDVAAQFTPGFPTLVISPPSLVVGVRAEQPATTSGLVAHIRAVLRDNLLAVESVVALAVSRDAGHEAIADASKQLGVPVLDVPPDAPADGAVGAGGAVDAVDAGGGGSADSAVVAAGARQIVPEHTASGGGGQTRVAVGRLDPHSPGYV